MSLGKPVVPLIRAAVEPDIEKVRLILVETWHDTYDALIGHERVVAITGRWHSAEVLIRQLIEPETSFLVATLENQLVGHAFVHARQWPTLILSRLYVLPRYQRRGIGTQLLDAAIGRYPGSNEIRLNVEAANLKGVSFYRKQGFVVCGEEIESGLTELRMAKALK